MPAPRPTASVAQEQAGLASGVVNTAFMMGGAVGLAVLASLADRRTETLLASGDGPLAALNSGYHVAFVVGALFVAASTIVGATLLRVEAPPRHGEEAIGVPAFAEAE